MDPGRLAITIPVPLHAARECVELARRAEEPWLSDEALDRIAILGSAEACREQVAGFVEAGVTTPVISPLATDRASIRAVFEAFAPARGS